MCKTRIGGRSFVDNRQTKLSTIYGYKPVFTQTRVIYGEIRKQNSNFHKGLELWAKSINDFGNFERHFPCATSAKILAAMYARVPQAMAQFVPKIEKLSHILAPTQGRGRRLPRFSYLDHPTKSDVISGLNCAAQLVSQSEKMAFRFTKIFFYLQTIGFVSFQTEGRNMLRAHFFDFESKTFGKRQQFIIVLKENN